MDKKHFQTGSNSNTVGNIRTIYIPTQSLPWFCQDQPPGFLYVVAATKKQGHSARVCERGCAQHKKKGSVEKFPKIENFVVHKKKNAPNRISNS